MSRAQANDSEDEESTFELSPFTVVGEDSGYAATNTLAGTRLNTSLKDIGTAISVVTKGLMEDIAATDADTLLTYTLGTEVGGVHGNFAGTSVANARPNSEGVRAEPTSNQRIRGLASAEISRNYFLTNIPFDSYNTSRVTINRGPNSLLFGVGSPGGVINHTTIEPIFEDRFAEVSFRIGSYGSHRETVDINQPLIENRLAIRIAAMNDQQDYRQEPAFEDDRRIFAALRGVLRDTERGSFIGDTIVRANAERGETDGLPPNIIPPSDGFSHWFGLPDIDYEQYTGIPMPDWYTEQTGWEPKQTIDNRTSGGAPYNTGPHTNPYFVHAGVYIDALNGPITFNTPDGEFQGGMGRLRYQQGNSGRPLMDQWISKPIETSDDYVTGFAARSVTREQFDWENHLISGDNGWRRRDWDAYNVTLEQGFWDYRAGIELAIDEQSYTRDSALPIGYGFTSGTAATDVNVDISEYLYDDVPNPNVGRPVMRDFGLPNHIVNEDKSAKRAQAFVRLLGEDLFGDGNGSFWFGEHTFTGVYMDQTFDNLRTSYNVGWDSDAYDNMADVLNNPNIHTWNRTMIPMVYVGPDMRGMSSPEEVRLNQISTRLPTGGETYNMWWWNRETAQMEFAEAYARRYLQSGDIERTEVDSKIFSWQSDLLAGHIKGLIGWRKDEQTAYEQVDVDDDRFDDGEYNPAYLVLADDAADVQSGSTRTWSVVGVYPERLLGDLPLGAELRVFANESENFNPVGARRNIYNEILESPSGKTEEWGIMLDLFEGKISARMSVYETAVTNQSLGSLSGAATGAMRWTVDWLQRARGAEQEGFTLQEHAPLLVERGITTYDQLNQAILDVTPEYMREIANYRLVPDETDPTFYEIQWDPINNLTVTTDSVSEGWELEITANPTRNLRLTFNLARQEAVQTNIAPALTQVAADFYARLLDSPLVGIDDSLADNSPTTYDSRYASEVNVPLAAEKSKEGTLSQELREWRANLVASYRFREGWLDGFTAGTAFRYQSKVATGYETAPNEDGLPVPILSNAYYDDAEIRGDFFFGYERPLMDGAIDWRIQLNIRNAIGPDDPIVVYTNPNGEHAVFRPAPSTEWFITNTFRF